MVTLVHLFLGWFYSLGIVHRIATIPLACYFVWRSKASRRFLCHHYAGFVWSWTERSSCISFSVRRCIFYELPSHVLLQMGRPAVWCSGGALCQSSQVSWVICHKALSCCPISDMTMSPFSWDQAVFLKYYSVLFGVGSLVPTSRARKPQ